MDSKHGADAPVVTVIMPNYNGARFIASSIASVLSQSLESLELLVIDDGSADDSISVVEAASDPRVRLIRQSHQGVCAARNRGIAEARGRYVAFLDSDDTWAGSCLERLHAALRAEPDAVLAYCGWQNVGVEPERAAGFVPPDYEGPDKLELCFRNSRWPIHAALTTREAIVAAGGFDPRFPTSEDFLLWVKIVAEHSIVRVPEVLAFYRHHEGPRATRDRLRMAMNHYSAQRGYLRMNPSVRKRLGRGRIRETTVGELLKRGYECYWQSDLDSARAIFRRVMAAGYGAPSDWKRMLPALLPLRLHQLLLQRRLSAGGTMKGN